MPANLTDYVCVFVCACLYMRHAVSTEHHFIFNIFRLFICIGYYDIDWSMWKFSLSIVWIKLTWLISMKIPAIAF